MPKILPPDFLRERQPLLGSEWEAFLQSYDTPRAYGLRRNPFQDCKTLPFPLEPVPWAADGYYFRPGDRPGRHPLHEAGAYYIQEPSAMSVVSLLDPQPGELVCDLCAAPGGKSTQMAAAMAGGKTTLENAAKEPHVVDAANFLNSMGANIRGAGTDVIRIVGVEKLHKTEYSIIPDQIEAGTFMLAAAATKGDITVKNVIPKHLEAISAKLLEIGCEVEEFDDAVRVVSSKPLHHTQVTTLPYPGFPTDMQPQIAVVLGISEGTSTVTESIFENRFKYVGELARMGANFKVESNIAIIGGVDNYTGARVNAPDLRAGAALVIAGLAAEGITVVDDIYYIERGYEEFEAKLASLGAVIEKVSTEKEIQKFTLKVS